MDQMKPPLKKLKIKDEVETEKKDLGVNATKTCKHWVKRKKRFCKMTPVKNLDYCGEHMPSLEESIDTSKTNPDIRIPCPLDNKHTIYQKNLRKHLKVCNVRVAEENKPEYIVKDVNAGDNKVIVEDLEALNNIRLNDLKDEEFYDVIKRVESLYEKYIENNVTDACNNNSMLVKEMNNEEYGEETRKHLLQVSALLSILENEQMLKDETSYIEFGAGKGQLTYYLAQALENKVNSHVVLIDRKSLRHKKDNKIEDRSRVQRIRADIADLVMDKLPLLQRCVAVSKHLCGAATDLTLRCITQCVNRRTNFILIALCCHHCCDWSSFVGKEFFQQHHLSQRDFVIITKMVSWATCGTGLSRERRKALEENNESIQEDKNLSINQRLSLAERETVGFKCKKLLDYARIEFLRCRGYEVTIKPYVPQTVTLENMVLLAKLIK